jgi:7-cyano-7-deazaguanine reductase
MKKKLKKAIKSPRTIKTDMVEIVDYGYEGRGESSITIVNGEFTSLCPRTGLPDFGTITIHYVPHRKIIELKSLKFYFLQYRNVGIFYEHIVNRMLDDLASLVEPISMEITGRFNIRGGISTTTKAVYHESCSEDEPAVPDDNEGPDPRD